MFYGMTEYMYYTTPPTQYSKLYVSPLPPPPKIKLFLHVYVLLLKRICGQTIINSPYTVYVRSA